MIEITSEEAIQDAKNVTIIGAIINIVLATSKFTVGWLFHSRALMADAVDSTTDLITDVITLVAYPASRKPVDDSHPYGHGKIETLASFIVAFFLLLAAGTIAFNAIKALINGDFPIPGWPALVVAFASLSVKEFLFHYTMRVGKRLNSKVIQANAWNHRVDAFSSIAVLIGVAGSILYPPLRSLDSWASLVVVFFIARAAYGIAFTASKDLLDASQDDDLLGSIEKLAETVDGVSHAHRGRSRRYGHMVYVDLDIEVLASMRVDEAHDLAHTVQKKIIDEFVEIGDVLIHVEPEGDHLHGEGQIRI